MQPSELSYVINVYAPEKQERRRMLDRWLKSYDTYSEYRGSFLLHILAVWNYKIRERRRVLNRKLKIHDT
jgi:hypothetical protein